MPDMYFSSNIPNYGQDEVHHWQFVPTGETRNMTLFYGRGADVTVKDPSIARIKEHSSGTGPQHQFVLIEGLKQGRTYIEAERNGEMANPWAIEVGDQIVVRVANFFLQLHHRAPAINQAALRVAFDAANDILRKQANVLLEPIGWPAKAVQFDDGRTNVITMPNGHKRAQQKYDVLLESVLALGDPNATLNAFFVKSIYESRGPLRRRTTGPTAFSKTWRHSVFLEDYGTPEKTGNTLAHEVCHAFGVDHIPDEMEGTREGRTRLMARSGNGATLTKDEIVTLREQDLYAI